MTTERHVLLRELRPNSIRIKLHSAIGEGLSANVFRGVREDSRGFTRQQVAVKITKSAREAGCLRREFETLLQVQSPHLVRVFAWDDHGDESMLSMEYIDGVALRELIDSCSLDEAMVAEIITQAQEGLRALDAKDLEHGDLSPDNILIDREGVVKLIDFANPERGSGLAHGTPPYMAPELWDGEAPTIKSDLFALGLIEHDLLARVRDFSFTPPIDKISAQQRCRRIARENPEHAWLSSAANLRTFAHRKSNALVQEALSELVERIRSGTKRAKTLPLENSLAAQAVIPETNRATVTSTEVVDAMGLPKIFTKSDKKSAKYGPKRGGFASLYQHRGVVAALIFFIVSCASGRDGRGIGSTPLANPKEIINVKMQVPLPPQPLPPGVSQVLRAKSDSQRTKNENENIKNLASVPFLAAGSLKIQTHRWMHFEIGKKDLGYAPVLLGHLKPGKYRLRWISSVASGVKTIEIRAARATKLNEKDFQMP